MKKFIRLLAVAASVGLLTGCSSLPKSLEHLKDDHSNLDIEINSPWGRQVLRRSNPYPVGAIITNGPTSIVVTGAPVTEAELLRQLRALPNK